MTTRLVLTDTEGGLAIVDMDHVICVCDQDGCTRIWFDDDDWLDVMDEVGEIVALLIRLDAL